MRRQKIGAAAAAAFLFLLASFGAPGVVRAEEGLVSSMGLMMAVPDINGITIAPANDVPVKNHTEDLAPPQVLEIIRPGMGPITVGRLSSSCSCLQASMVKRSFAAGERAFIEIRNIKPTPPNGAKFAIFAQLSSPVKEVLQYDLFVKSGFPAGRPSVDKAASAPAAKAPMAGPIVRQSNPGPDSGVEIVVPHAPSPAAPSRVVDLPPAVPGEPIKAGPNFEVRHSPGSPKPLPFGYEDITPYRSRSQPPASTPEPEPESGD